MTTQQTVEQALRVHGWSIECGRVVTLMALTLTTLRR